ncbi:hypothetical protein FISHEDRAFT_70132 [Fistulina hepatica ATCC 64428]|uniref:Uncharacterized protein n=1 Tax=Fistulina hepatica ATCC 64428 TaxID=1128425 RepID=A0A0D7AJZ4_9AGAR|nr:hypothetical protein FISHEDRAFT_70132 [Fistulina hepatica ATCC 64428]
MATSTLDRISAPISASSFAVFTMRTAGPSLALVVLLIHILVLATWAVELQPLGTHTDASSISSTATQRSLLAPNDAGVNHQERATVDRRSVTEGHANQMSRRQNGDVRRFLRRRHDDAGNERGESSQAAHATSIHRRAFGFGKKKDPEEVYWRISSTRCDPERKDKTLPSCGSMLDRLRGKWKCELVKGHLPYPVCQTRISWEQLKNG